MDYRQSWEHKEYLSERRLARRVFLFHACLVLCMAGFLLDFWHLQMVRGAEFADLAENNRLRRIPLRPTRGVIEDREGRTLASTRPALSLILSREDARDIHDQIHRLAPILGVPPEELEERLHRMRRRPLFEPLVLREDATLDEIAWIEARRELFPSVEVLETARRSYPQQDLVAHALGYVGEISQRELALRNESEGIRSGDIVGKAGVERLYDEGLRGRTGWEFVSVNTLGRRLTLGRSRVGRDPQNGSRLRLTLDLDLQRTLREAFADEAGGAVFMDPWTGEILALASAPFYDPNVFADGITHDEWESIQGDPRRPLHDRTISSSYAPGSTFKIVLAVAGLETGTITPDETVYCAGSVRIYDRPYRCWKRGGHGRVDMREALTHSCNVYFYLLGQKLGVEAIHRYGSMFGLGRKTGVDLPGERPGVLPSDEWKRQALREPWYPGDTISVAIGQGLLTVTPMQLAKAISGVATGGRVPRPYIVAGQEPEVTTVRIRPEHLEVIRGALVDTVREGTARRAALPDVQVAGKTGTAQVYKHSAGIDADKLPKPERDHAWFVGYAPAERPRIAFAIVVEHGGHGGTSAAPIARKVLEVFFAGRSASGTDELQAATGYASAWARATR